MITYFECEKCIHNGICKSRNGFECTHFIRRDKFYYCPVMPGNKVYIILFDRKHDKFMCKIDIVMEARYCNNMITIIGEHDLAPRLFGDEAFTDFAMANVALENMNRRYKNASTY